MDKKAVLIVADDRVEIMKALKSRAMANQAAAMAATLYSALTLAPAHLIDDMIEREFPQKEGRKCLLPNCNELTVHNGGYCCANHCKLHKQLIKERSK